MNTLINLQLFTFNVFKVYITQKSSMLNIQHGSTLRFKRVQHLRFIRVPSALKIQKSSTFKIQKGSIFKIQKGSTLKKITHIKVSFNLFQATGLFLTPEEKASKF